MGSFNIQQSNFNNFQIARMNTAHYQTNVHLVESGALPTGVGEPGVPPAIAVQRFRVQGSRFGSKVQGSRFSTSQSEP
jgi:isoquinoline 1-oxidoreductase beta subunit